MTTMRTALEFVLSHHRPARYAAGLAVALTSLAGCDAAGSTNAPSPEDAAPNVEAALDYDAELAQVAREVDGFAGFYDGDDGALVAVVAGDVAARRDGAALQEALATAAERLYGAGGGSETARRQGIRVVPGTYDFAQLYGWKEAATGVLALDGTTSLDIDEVENRLTVGVHDAGARASVEAALRAAGVPEGAVTVVEEAPVTFEATLRDERRPTAGGMQISFRRGSSAFACTYGFNALSGSGDSEYFVTNSHCTEGQGGDQNTTIYQPTVSSANAIGVEARDPGYSSGLSGCPSGRRCRRSDAALIRRSVPGDLGRIIRTDGLNTGSLERDGTFRITEVASQNAPVNSFVAKVGRTTGWTNGRVRRTCVTFSVSNTDLALVCQNQADYGSAGGDSGSPVFNDTGNGTARLRGIHWGSGGVYSPVRYVRSELGSGLRFN